jgi:hypothetical protein
MRAQVGAGELTAGERDTVLREMEEKLAALRLDGAGSARAADALAARRAEVRAACDRAPAAVHAVRGLAELRRARAALAGLARLEAANEGKMLSPAERHALSKELDARPRLAAREAELVADARGWLETPAEFEARVKEQAAAAGPLKGAAKPRK